MLKGKVEEISLAASPKKKRRENKRKKSRDLEDCFRGSNIWIIGASKREQENRVDSIKEIIQDSYSELKDKSYHIQRAH